MGLPSLGVFTPYTLMLHQDATGESAMTFLKRSLILFEKLMIIPDGLPMSGGHNALTKERYLGLLGRGDSFCSTSEFTSLFLLSEEVLDKDLKLMDVLDNSEDDLWGGEHGDRFVKFVEDLVEAQIAGSGGRLDESDAWEMKKAYVGNISSDYQTLMLVTKLGGDYSGLFTEFHEAAAKATLGIGTPSHDSVVRSVGQVNTLDFGSLTWDQVMELRRSGYCASFRKWANDWVSEYRDTGDAQKFEERLRRATEEAKFALIGQLEPSITKSVLGAIVGNLPIPIANPYSIVSGLNLVKQSIERKRDYGWLFFVQHAFKAVHEEASTG